MSAYEITLPLFQGPLDLLLHLIEREELDISTVSLARVTEQYLAYLARADDLEAGALADFLVIATRLIWIKSRMLLPQPAPPVEEEEDDPGEALARQLRAYKQYKTVAIELRQREQQGLRAYVRVVPTPTLERRLEIGDLSLADLLAAMLRVLAETPVTSEGILVQPFRVTIHDKIALTCRLLGQRPLLRFRQLLEQATSRVDIVVSLLAILELIKRRQVVVEQNEPFGDIMIRPAPGVDPTTLAAAPGDGSTNGREAGPDTLP